MQYTLEGFNALLNGHTDRALEMFEIAYGLVASHVRPNEPDYAAHFRQMQWSRQLNASLKSMKVEIVQGLFPACGAEYSSAAEEPGVANKRKIVIGWGPKQFLIKPNWMLWKGFYSKKGDEFGDEINTVVFYSGSEKMAAGLYHRRFHFHAKCDYLLHESGLAFTPVFADLAIQELIENKVRQEVDSLHVDAGLPFDQRDEWEATSQQP